MMHTLKSSPIHFLMHNDDLAFFFCCLVSRVFHYHTHLVSCSPYQVKTTYKRSLDPQESSNKISGNVLVPWAV